MQRSGLRISKTWFDKLCYKLPCVGNETWYDQMCYKLPCVGNDSIDRSGIFTSRKIWEIVKELLDVQTSGIGIKQYRENLLSWTIKPDNLSLVEFKELKLAAIIWMYMKLMDNKLYPVIPSEEQVRKLGCNIDELFTHSPESNEWYRRCREYLGNIYKKKNRPEEACKNLAAVLKNDNIPWTTRSSVLRMISELICNNFSDADVMVNIVQHLRTFGPTNSCEEFLMLNGCENTPMASLRWGLRMSTQARILLGEPTSTDQYLHMLANLCIFSLLRKKYIFVKEALPCSSAGEALEQYLGDVNEIIPQLVACLQRTYDSGRHWTKCIQIAETLVQQLHEEDALRNQFARHVELLSECTDRPHSKTHTCKSRRTRSYMFMCFVC